MNLFSASLAGAAKRCSDNDIPIGKDAETINAFFNQSLLFSMIWIVLFLNKVRTIIWIYQVADAEIDLKGLLTGPNLHAPGDPLNSGDPINPMNQLFNLLVG